jgi:hypothetical protein
MGTRRHKHRNRTVIRNTKIEVPTHIHRQYILRPLHQSIKQLYLRTRILHGNIQLFRNLPKRQQQITGLNITLLTHDIGTLLQNILFGDFRIRIIDDNFVGLDFGDDFNLFDRGFCVEDDFELFEFGDVEVEAMAGLVVGLEHDGFADFEGAAGFCGVGEVVHYREGAWLHYRVDGDDELVVF